MGCSSSTRSINTLEDTKINKVNLNDSSTNVNKKIEKSEKNFVKSPGQDIENINVIDNIIKGANKVVESEGALEKKKEFEGYLKNVPTAKAMIVFEEDDLTGNIEVDKEKEAETEVIPVFDTSTNSIDSIMNNMKYFIEKHEIPEKKIRLKLSHSVIVEKSEYDTFEINTATKFSFVGANKKIKWNKKPFSQLVNDITQYFNHSRLHDYFGFEWNSYLVENEKHKIEFKLRKSNPGSEKFDDIKIETLPHDKVRVFVIFSENDLNAINKIKEISILKRQFDDFEFYPIFGSTIKKKEEAQEKITFLSNLGINDTELCFFKKKNDDSKLEKFINYISNDNKNEVISTVIVFDKNAYIRYIGTPANFYVDSIKSYSDSEFFTQEDYERAKDYLINILPKSNNLAICGGRILLTKIELFDANLNLVESFYDPLKIEIRNNEDYFRSNFKEYKYAIINRKSLEMKLKLKNESLKLHVNKILQDMEINLDKVQFTGEFSVIKRFHSALSDKMKRFKGSHDKKKFSNFTFHLNTDQFEQLQVPLLDQMGQLRLNPLLEKIKYLSICPLLESKFPKTLNLIDAEENKEIQVELDETLPKIFLIIRNCKNSDEKLEVTQYLTRLWNNMAAKENLLSNIQLFFIYTGDSYEEAKELTADSFSNQKIYLINSSYSSNFPYAIDNDGPRIFLILNNKDNILKYQGTPSEISITETLSNMVEGNDSISYKPNYPMSYDNYKFNLKKTLKDFLKLLEDSYKNSKHLYKPIIQFSMTKECHFINHELAGINCKNIRLKILMKTVSESLITGNEEIKQMLKNMQKEYGVVLKILKIPCVSLDVPTDNICNKCHNEIKIIKDSGDIYEFFYDQESNMSYCTNCEKDLKNYENNLLYLKYPKENDVILSEVIQGFYEMNLKARTHLEHNTLESCSICNVSLQGHHIVWMSLIHLNHVVDYEEEITLPVVICDKKCFPHLQDKENENKNLIHLNYDLELNREEKEKLKLCAIDKNNLLFKKIILPK